MNTKRWFLGTIAAAIGVAHLAASLHLWGTYGDGDGDVLPAVGSAAALVGAVGFTLVGARYLGPDRGRPRDEE